MSDSLTVEKIKRMIQEEKKALKGAGLLSEPEENAWSGGKNLVHKIDYIKKLGIKEQKLLKKADVYRKLREKLETSIKRSK